MQHASGHPTATWIHDRMSEGHDPTALLDVLWQQAAEQMRPAIERYAEGVVAVRRLGQ